MLTRLGIEHGGLVRPTERVEGARHPVRAARLTDRRRDIVPQAGEMREGVLGAIEVNQGEPAGHEFGISEIGVGIHSVSAGELIGSAIVTIADQREDHELALGPHQFQRGDVGITVGQLQQKRQRAVAHS